jgi:hypothetical protein
MTRETAHLYAKVDQVGQDVASDSTTEFVPLYQNREHALQINSREGLVDQWTRDGRVFIANNPVIGQPETMSAAGTAITLTAPSIRYTIPSGVIVVPIHVALSIITVGAKDDIFGVLVNNADSYTSGGDAVAMLCKNALINGTTELRSTGTTNRHYSDTAIVEAALTDPRLLKIQESQPPATNQTWNPEYNILKGDPMVYVVGPASFLVFAVQETTAAEAEFSMSWAELQADTVP